MDQEKNECYERLYYLEALRKSYCTRTGKYHFHSGSKISESTTHNTDCEKVLRDLERVSKECIERLDSRCAKARGKERLDEFVRNGKW